MPPRRLLLEGHFASRSLHLKNVSGHAGPGILTVAPYLLQFYLCLCGTKQLDTFAATFALKGTYHKLPYGRMASMA